VAGECRRAAGEERRTNARQKRQRRPTDEEDVGVQPDQHSAGDPQPDLVGRQKSEPARDRATQLKPVDPAQAAEMKKAPRIACGLVEQALGGLQQASARKAPSLPAPLPRTT